MSDSIPRDFVWMSDGGDLGDLTWVEKIPKLIKF